MSNYIPEGTIQEIVDNTDIIQLVSEYVRLEKRGKNYLGLCPFHSENTPSFNVSPDKKLFYCFGCGAGGDVITFIMKIENLNFPEAVESLAKRAGIQFSITNTNKRHFKNNGIYHLNEIAQKYFTYFLWQHESAEEARSYLKKRGLNKSVIQKFALGYAPKSWQALYTFLKKKGFSENDIVKSGLVSKSQKGRLYDRFRDRLIFPIHDSKGKIVGFGGRQISDDKDSPKYLNSPETEIFHKSKILYGLNWSVSELRSQNQALIVEGYMDVIACHQFGFTNSIASLGTAFTEEHAKILKRYCDEVIIAYDADSAGMQATLRGIDILQKAGCRIKILQLPAGSDPDEYLRKNGREGFLQALKENTLSLIDYKLSIALQKNNIYTPEGKTNALNFIISNLTYLASAVERQYFVQKISLKLQIPENIVLEEISKRRKLQKFGTKQDKKEIIRHNTKETLNPAGISISASERMLLRYIFEDVNIFMRIKEEIGFNFFSEEVKKILFIIDDKLQKGAEFSPTILFNRLREEDNSLALFVTSLLSKEEQFPISLEDCIRDIKLKHWQKQEQELLSELADAEQKNDSIAQITLIREIVEVQKYIQALKNG